MTNLRSKVRLFYSPLAISASFYGYFKPLKLHRTERSRNQDVRFENRTQDVLHQGRTLTDCAILAPPKSILLLLNGFMHSVLNLSIDVCSLDVNDALEFLVAKRLYNRKKLPNRSITLIPCLSLSRLKRNNN